MRGGRCPLLLGVLFSVDVRAVVSPLSSPSGTLALPARGPHLAEWKSSPPLVHHAIVSPDSSRLSCVGERNARLVRPTASVTPRALWQQNGGGAVAQTRLPGELQREQLCRQALAWRERSALCATLHAAEGRHTPSGTPRGPSAAVSGRRPSNPTGCWIPSWPRRGRLSCAMMMTPPEEVECDVLIVGAGPAGCTCALYTSRANLKTVILDKNPATGALAITSHIANYPGVDRTMSGKALLDQMTEQAIQYGTEYRRAQVFLVDTEGEDGWKSVYTPDATFKAKTLVLATGAMGRPPSFTNEDTYLGRGVSYCATCDGAFYEGSEVAVVGSNLEAVEEAQFLTKFASTVHWVTPVNPKPDDEHAQDLLQCSNVKHWSSTRLQRIDGDDDGVTGIELKAKTSDEPVHLPLEGVFIYVAGSKPITDFLEGSSVALNEEGGVIVNDEMATNVPGVFAIGDIRNTPYKQVVVAAADGCIAAMSIDRYLKGRKNVRVDWIHQ